MENELRFDREDIFQISSLETYILEDSGIQVDAMEPSIRKMTQISSDSCNIAGTLTSLVNDAALSAVALFESATNRALKEIIDLTQRIMTAFITDELRDEFKTRLEQLEESIVGSDEEHGILKTINNFIGFVESGVRNVISVIAPIIEFVNEIMIEIDDTITALIQNISGVLTDLSALACDGIVNVLDGVNGNITDSLNSLTDSVNKGKTPLQGTKDIHTAGLQNNSTTSASEIQSQNNKISGINVREFLGLDTVEPDEE